MRVNGASMVGLKSKMSSSFSRAYLPLIVILLSSILFHCLSGESFLTARNLSNLSRQICINATLAVGMTLVILTSGIDLSVGSVLALSGMVGAITQVKYGFASQGGWGALASFLCSLSVGGICGAFTGFAVSRLHITPFIVTLGMMVICRGMILILSHAQSVAPVGESLGSLSSDYFPPIPSLILLIAVAAGVVLIKSITAFRGGSRSRAMWDSCLAILLCTVASFIFCGYRGIPYMVFVAAGCACTGGFILKFTRFGRFIYAIGGNREAAELSGLPVAPTLWVTYFLMGLLSALAGVMDIARVNAAVPSAGELAELDAIAAVVIGGTSLMGGSGSVGGTLFGVLIMGILNNGMSLMGITEHYQKVFKGIVIVLAVYIDIRAKRK